MNIYLLLWLIPKDKEFEEDVDFKSLTTYCQSIIPNVEPVCFPTHNIVKLPFI